MGPPTWAYFEQVAVYERLSAQYGYVCGLAWLGIILIGCFAAALLSGTALWLGWLAYRALPHPRPRLRIAKLTLIAVPLILPVAFVVSLYSA